VLRDEDTIVKLCLPLNIRVLPIVDYLYPL